MRTKSNLNVTTHAYTISASYVFKFYMRGDILIYALKKSKFCLKIGTYSPIIHFFVFKIFFSKIFFSKSEKPLPTHLKEGIYQKFFFCLPHDLYNLKFFEIEKSRSETELMS